MTLEELKKTTNGVNTFWAEKMPMMAMEEMAELTQALSKKERDPLNVDKEGIKEEMRDVLICIGALMNRYDISPDDVELAVEEKLGVVYSMKKDLHEMIEDLWSDDEIKEFKDPSDFTYSAEENRRFLEEMKEELYRKAFSIWY